MKFKYRWLLIRSVALIMVIYISVLALSMPVGAVVDTSRGEGDDYDLTSASTFPMTVGFAFRSSSDSEYNYITATDIGGYGQEFNRTLTGTDEFTYTFDELNENATTKRYLHYTFGDTYWSSQDLFGYRYGYQPVVLSCDTLGTNEACETIVLRAPDVVFNTYVFDYYRDANINTIADLAYLGVPVISAPQVVGPSESRYVGTCSVIYTVTDQHGNTKKFNYAVSYSSNNNDYIPLLNMSDLYTYYGSPDSAVNSSKILISDWYVYWDVDYYEYVDNTEPSFIDVRGYGANGNIVVYDDIDITDDIGLTFSQWASHFSQDNYSVNVTDDGVELTYTSGSDTYTGYIYDGIDRVTGSTFIAEGKTYGASLDYVHPNSYLLGAWVLKSGAPGNVQNGRAIYALSQLDFLYGSFFTEDSTYNLRFAVSSNENFGVTAYQGVDTGQQYWNTYYLNSSGNITSWTLNPRAFVRVEFNSNILNDDIVVADYFKNWLFAYFVKETSSAASVTTLSDDSAVAASSESVSTLSDEPAVASEGEWVEVDSDKRNIVQIGYPLYDTSSGDPDYAELLGYPNFENFLKGSTIDIPTVPGFPGDSDEEVSSLTRWLGVAVSGFTDVELWDGFSIGGVLAIIVSFSVVMMFLKVFAGG